jgi:hypothetical protein
MARQQRVTFPATVPHERHAAAHALRAATCSPQSALLCRQQHAHARRGLGVRALVVTPTAPLPPTTFAAHALTTLPAQARSLLMTNTQYLNTPAPDAKVTHGGAAGIIIGGVCLWRTQLRPLLRVLTTLPRSLPAAVHVHLLRLRCVVRQEDGQRRVRAVCAQGQGG